MINSTEECPAYSYFIHIAGDLDKITKSCGEYCTTVGLCVTVTPTNYVYKNGSETGARIGLINYPRFPSSEAEIFVHANNLAFKIATDCNQMSYTVEGPNKMLYNYDRNLKPMPKEVK